MKSISPYLHFEGNAEEAFNFYKSIFGGELQSVQRYRDNPQAPESSHLKEEDMDKIMHISLLIGEGIVLMGSDVPPGMNFKLQPGNNSYIYLNTGSEQETSRIFNRLSQGGQVLMPLENVFWGALFGMVKDRFGFQWMVSFDERQG